VILNQESEVKAGSVICCVSQGYHNHSTDRAIIHSNRFKQKKNYK